MKAISIQAYGGPEALRFEDTPNPDVKHGQVLVEVVATSVNHIDIMMASGAMKDSNPLEFPWIPGVDFSGRVDYVAPGVKGIEAGDEVYGKVMRGTYAEYIAVDISSLAPMPSNLSFAEAASVPHTGLTAWEAVFDHGRFEPGQTVVIHGAAGAVGAFALQFVKLGGGFVYAVADGKDRRFLESLGADVVIDFTQNDFAEIAKDADLVLDFVGKNTPTKSYPIIKKGGRLVTTATKIDPKESKAAGVEAVSMGVEPNRENLTEITRLIEQGKIKTDVADIFPLSEARQAWNEYTHQTEQRKPYTHGKIVLYTRK